MNEHPGNHIVLIHVHVFVQSLNYNILIGFLFTQEQLDNVNFSKDQLLGYFGISLVLSISQLYIPVNFQV